MEKILKRGLRAFQGAVALLLVLSVAFAAPVWAIDNPDEIRIIHAGFFEDILEDGDILAAALYNLNYTTLPDVGSDAAFVFAVYDSAGDTLVAPTRGIQYYGYGVIGIYLSAANNTMVSESAYKFRIMGSLSYFGNLTEDVNMDTKTASASDDWYTSSELTGALLTWAKLLDTYIPTEDLLNDNDVLNNTGAAYFLDGIGDGLVTMAPGIFASISIPIDYTADNWTYGGINVATNNTPLSLNNAFAGLNELFGIDPNSGWGHFNWLLMGAMMVGAVFFAATGRPDVAALGGVMPTMGLGAYMGVAQGNIILLVMSAGAIIITLFIIEFVIPRYG